MNEHEKLKYVCDKIGFYHNSYDEKREIFKEWTGENERRLLDVREIIFTNDFRDKLRDYYLLNINENESVYERDCLYNLMLSLDNPVEYLYNLIK